MVAQAQSGGPMFLFAFKPEFDNDLRDVADRVRSELNRLLSRTAIPSFETQRDAFAFDCLLPYVPRCSRSLLNEDSLDAFDLTLRWQKRWSRMEYDYGQERESVGKAAQSMNLNTFVETCRQMLSARGLTTATLASDPRLLQPTSMPAQ